ncbi:MAG TPA: glycosyltransferase family 39 protein, partial [Pyrinomonadaceae bacterium]|nr:glycosyltransferase family 39 protein [Pyrinomonadaceae bacterium]
MIEKIKDLISDSLSSRRRKLFCVIAASVAVIYLSLAIGAAATKSPWCDEAWFASPAFNLSTRGFMGTTVLESSGTWLEGIDEYTYWIPPAYVLAQSGWYEVFGFSLLSMRSLSAAFGLLALFSWFFFVKDITGEVETAILALVVIALDYCFIMTASVGRMDMMSAALNIAAFAA